MKTKHRLYPLLAAALVLAGLAGCGGEASGSGQSDPNAQLANPVVEVEGPAAFAELGILLAAPAGAEEAVHSIIGGEIAQIAFSLEDAAYTLRAAEMADWTELAGVYEEMDGEPVGILMDYAGQKLSASLYTTASGGRIATWRWEPFAYTLYTPAAVDNNALAQLATELAAGSYQP